MIPDPKLVIVQGGVVHSTPRPADRSTYFASTGDADPAGTVGEGATLLVFDMKAADTEDSKSVDVAYSEEVLIKDGAVLMKDCPLGSFVDATMWEPTGSVQVGSFVRKAALLGSGWYPFNTDDYGTLPPGFILRLTVTHAPTKVDFQAVARVEMFRVTTVGVPPV